MILEIKQYFDDLRQRVTPDIKHYVCGCDEKALRETVAKFDGPYLFVDFGAFSTTTDRDGRLNDTFEIGVTVAVPLGSRLVSNDEILAEMDQCFNAVAKVRSAMIKGGRKHPLMKRLSDTHDILPFTAPDIARSIGSTFSFHLRSLDMLDAK